MCKDFKVTILFVFIGFVSGCSDKYIIAREKGLIDREWRVLDAEILGPYDVGLVLSLKVKEFVEVRDSVKLAEFYESERREVGRLKILGGCAIAGCAALASAGAMFSWLNDPSGLNFAWFYGIVGGVGTLSFIISGISDLSKSDRAEPYYIKKNVICKNSKPLRDYKVKIMLENTNSEKTYYTDENGNLELKFDEIIPESTEVDST
ncbi:MAG: hypothetical protein P8Y62_03000, partial [candidate division WOR-3 bacterium]